MRNVVPPEKKPRPFKRPVSEHKPRSGRPRIVTPQMKEEIVARITAGETLKGICQHWRMPTRQAVSYHAKQDPEFFASLLHAREAWAERCGRVRPSTDAN